MLLFDKLKKSYTRREITSYISKSQDALDRYKENDQSESESNNIIKITQYLRNAKYLATLLS